MLIALCQLMNKSNEEWSRNAWIWLCATRHIALPFCNYHYMLVIIQLLCKLITKITICNIVYRRFRLFFGFTVNRHPSKTPNIMQRKLNRSDMLITDEFFVTAARSNTNTSMTPPLIAAQAALFALCFRQVSNAAQTLARNSAALANTPSLPCGKIIRLLHSASANVSSSATAVPTTPAMHARFSGIVPVFFSITVPPFPTARAFIMLRARGKKAPPRISYGSAYSGRRRQMTVCLSI